MSARQRVADVYCRRRRIGIDRIDREIINCELRCVVFHSGLNPIRFNNDRVIGLSVAVGIDIDLDCRSSVVPLRTNRLGRSCAGVDPYAAAELN